MAKDTSNSISGSQFQTPKMIFERALTQLEEYKKEGDADRFADLQDICHYYVAYLEEEAEGGAGSGANSLKEQRAVKARMIEKGLFDTEKFNSRSILVGLKEQGLGASDQQSSLFGGVGRKRQNTEGVQQLESQTI